MMEILEKEKISLKAKYKKKIIIKQEAIRAEVTKELLSCKAELEYKTELLEKRSAELEALYTRVEELEMAHSSSRIEVEDIERRHKLQIQFLKSECDSMVRRLSKRIQEVQLEGQRELKNTEETFLNRIEEYKARLLLKEQEEHLKASARVEEMRISMQTEIEKLNGIIVMYKDKLTRKESEVRNLLVELKL